MSEGLLVTQEKNIKFIKSFYFRSILFLRKDLKEEQLSTVLLSTAVLVKTWWGVCDHSFQLSLKNYIRVLVANIFFLFSLGWWKSEQFRVYSSQSDFPTEAANSWRWKPSGEATLYSLIYRFYFCLEATHFIINVFYSGSFPRTAWREHRICRTSRRCGHFFVQLSSQHQV